MKRTKVAFAFLLVFLGFFMFVQGCRWVASSSQDPRAPAPDLGWDTAIVNSSVKTLEFDYDEDSSLITVQIEACPPLMWGQFVGGDALQRMAREELKRQIGAFKVQHPESKIAQTGYDSTLATNMFRSAENGDRKTVVTATYRVE